MAHKFVLASALTLGLLSSACIVLPVPAPTIARGLPQPPRLTLHAGITTRDEFAQLIADIDTGVSTPTFAWARWEESDSGLIGAAYGGGYHGERFWKVHNLVATFDARGLLQDYADCSDEELFFHLDRVGSQMQPVTEPAAPILFRFQSTRWKGTPFELEVGTAGLRYEETLTSRVREAHLSTIRRVQTKKGKATLRTPSYFLKLVIQTGESPPFPRSITVAATPQEAWQLLNLLRQTGMISVVERRRPKR